MTCFYIDESGYTGFDLFNREQRFQGATAVSINDEEASRLIREYFPKLQAPELKYRALARRPGYRQPLMELQRTVLSEHKCVTYVCDKRYLLTLMFLDYATEPYYYERNVDFYKDGQNFAMGSLLFTVGPSMFGNEDFNDLLATFQRAVKNKTPEALDSLVAVARAMDWRQLPEALGPIAEKSPECLSAIATPGISTDAVLVVLQALISRMEAMSDGPCRVEHDKSKNLARALAAYSGGKPILVLTHTNAGVAALHGRLERAGVSAGAYRLSTIDGWALRLILTFPGRSAHDPEITRLAVPKRDYSAIRKAAWRLLQGGHINAVVAASYGHLIVDEYQDCSVPQHHLVFYLLLILPTCVLGYPMQAIFGFRGNALADWNEVCTHFPVIGELTNPWRWRNAGAEALGQWLLDVCRLLASGQSVDLRTGPTDHVTWIPTVVPNDHQQRLAAARTVAPTADGRVLIIADSRNPTAQRIVASQTPGATTVEAVDLQDLISFCASFDVSAPDARAQILAFAQSVMTNVGVAKMNQRLDSLSRGTAKKPPNEAERLALEFGRAPSLGTAIGILSALRTQPNVLVYRPAILFGVLKALREASLGNVPLAESARRVREENRFLGRPLPKRAVGSTLLLKGLEAEMAVLLDTNGMSPQHLYVSMTRGSMKLVVCSPSPMLG